MNNIEELRAELAGVFTQLKTGVMKHSDARELANISGKMIASAKLQLEYCKLRKEAPDIPFIAHKKK